LEEECLKRNNKFVTPEIVQDAMTRCGRVVCVCESQKRLYSPKAPTRVAYVGVPDPRDQGLHVGSAAKADATEPKRPFTFLTLGIVCPRKNQHFAVKLFKQLCDRTGASDTELRLIIVGVRRERDYEREYAELVINEINGDPRIEIHDVTTDTGAFFCRADALLFPSLNEVTPCVIADAMSHGLPVVATNIAGIPEMVCDGVEGFLAHPDDLELFVKQMHRLYSDPALCQTMGSAGRAKFESKFSMQSMVRTFQSIIAEVAPPRTVLVDMDGCLVDWDLGFRAAWANRSSINRQASYAMESCVPPEFKEEACMVFHEQGFFSGLPPMEGGLRALAEMREAGLNVLLCTSPVLTSRYCAAEKFEWIERHLGTEWLARVVLTTDKTMVKGDVLIDDKPRITGFEAEPEWQQIVFNAPYNAGTKHSVRLSHWANWRDALSAALHQPM
jgi:5'-nucleotidase